MINGKNFEKQSDKTYIGIVGSRTFTNKRFFFEAIKQFLPLCLDKKIDNIVIVSGGANGTDQLAEQFAARFYTEDPWIFLPEPSIISSKGFGVAAHLRNRQIVAASDYIVAFWDGSSPGTRSTINYAQQAGRPVIIIWIR